MIDDDDAHRSPEGDALLYDYFKHLTSLCLFSLGGVIALAEKVQGRSAGLLIGALIVIGFAALISFTASGQIVEARFDGKPLASNIGLSRRAAPFLLSVGLGMFMYLFTGSLRL